MHYPYSQVHDNIQVGIGLQWLDDQYTDQDSLAGFPRTNLADRLPIGASALKSELGKLTVGPCLRRVDISGMCGPCSGESENLSVAQRKTTSLRPPPLLLAPPHRVLKAPNAYLLLNAS